MASARKRSNEELPSEFFHLFVNSPIDGQLYRKIINAIPPEKPDCGVVSLVTLGGSPHDAYRIGRYLQMAFGKELFIHVPTTCASAGTLLVCAGSGLIISAMSELGPLDAQLLKSDEIRTRRSGLVTRSLFENLGAHAFELHTSLVERIIEHSDGTIKYRTAAHVAGEMVVGLMHGLYEQMNPEQIGEDYRFLKIAEEYGKRLADKYQNISLASLITLVYDFPSHDFIIDFREAIRLFERVDVPSSLLLSLMSDESRMPISPVGPRDRIVNGAIIKGCPIYEDAQDQKAHPHDQNHGKLEKADGGSSRSSEIGGNGADQDKPRPARQNAHGNPGKGGQRAKANKDPSSEESAT
ncbi:MAG TPA: hypothetical protein VEH76_03470 [Methylocystis sp.]|nr:hypothetical protein [Methylocystis sp.]